MLNRLHHPGTPTIDSISVHFSMTFLNSHQQPWMVKVGEISIKDLLRWAPLPKESCRVALQGVQDGCWYSNRVCLEEPGGGGIACLTSTSGSADPRLNASVTHSLNPVSAESSRQPLASQTEPQIG